jgi:hypothetical protein
MVDGVSDVDRVRSLLRQAAYAGIVTTDEAQTIGRVFIDHGGATEIRRDLLTDDELEACSRVCVWLESTGGVQ